MNTQVVKNLKSDTVPVQLPHYVLKRGSQDQRQRKDSESSKKKETNCIQGHPSMSSSRLLGRN